MGNLIKYEIKGSYKVFLSVFIVALLANLGLYTRINKWPNVSILALTILVITIMTILTFVFSANSFEKELYEDRGYLTLTLPVSGNKIVGAKLINCFIWLLLSLALTIMSILIYSDSILKDIVSKLGLVMNIKLAISICIVKIIILTASMLLLIFFSIALSKSITRRKKFSKLLGIAFFILAIFLIANLEYIITKYIPYNLVMDFGNNSATSIKELGIAADAFVFNTENNMSINIASNIYNILVIIGLFIGTGYLIDKKVDI